MADVLISEFMDEGAAAELIAEYDVHWDPELWSKRDELLEHIREARAIIVRNATQVDAELLDHAPALKVVARMGVGLDNIDVDTCKSLGIEVCPSIGANALSVAEYVITSALILLRRQAFRSTARLVNGEWPRESLARGLELSGRTIGIIGFGSIGQVTGEKAKAVGMNVVAYDAVLPADAAAWQGVKRTDLASLIAEADVISLHCPLTPETRGLIGPDEMARMQQGAILINSARGGIVDEAACAAALRSGHLGGAALDTFDREPIEPAVGALFADLDNVILTPHIAGVTLEANKRIADVAVTNVRRILGSAS